MAGFYTKPLFCARDCYPYWREIWLERAEREDRGVRTRSLDWRKNNGPYTLAETIQSKTYMKTKVLIIVENLPVPFDSRVWKEACALHSNGYEVTVLCPRGKGYERGYEVLESVRIYRHPASKEGNSALGYVWEFGWALFWEFFYACGSYLRHGFHIIQGCNPPDDIFLIALPYKLFGVKYIFDHHDANPELYLSKYGKTGFFYKSQVWLERMTYRCSNVVMATNDSYKDLAVAPGRA